MNCREIRYYIDDYLVGNLSPGLKEGFELHLQSCFDCRDYVDEEKNLRDRFRNLPTPQPPESYWQQLETKIGARVLASEINRIGGGYLPSPSKSVWPILVPLAAVLALLFLSFSWQAPGGRKVSIFSPELIGNYSVVYEEFQSDTTSVPEIMNSLLLTSPGTAGYGLIQMERLTRMGWEEY
ncbi:hypothetical protein TRIP_C60327 [Candidatus Zixiibacteriota bacterium]|nr:hypothetical protein TRIP_C60327 [candidate division Zixibacteria bacterium]